MKSQKEDLWSDMHNMIGNSKITKKITNIIIILLFNLLYLKGQINKRR
jgi:hypothetical protein